MKANKKGSVMTEAAMVMPLCILAVISIMVILLIIHQRVGTQSKLHQTARIAAGERAGVWRAADTESTEEDDLSVTYHHGLLFPRMELFSKGTFGGLFLLEERDEVERTSVLVVDEAQIMRNVQLILEKGADWFDAAAAP